MQSNSKCVKRPTLREKRPKRQCMRGYHVYMIIWKPLVGECLQCLKEPTNEVDKNVVALVFTNALCKKEVVSHVQQKSP